MKALDGPRIGPKRGRAASLIVLLHGYGANGDDLIALGEAWRETLPTAAFIAPNAPDPLPHAALGGLQWFPLTFRDPGEYWRGVSAVGPLLDAFLDRELLRYGLPGERLAAENSGESPNTPSRGTRRATRLGTCPRLQVPAETLVSPPS